MQRSFLRSKCLKTPNFLPNILTHDQENLHHGAKYEAGRASSCQVSRQISVGARRFEPFDLSTMTTALPADAAAAALAAEKSSKVEPLD